MGKTEKQYKQLSAEERATIAIQAVIRQRSKKIESGFNAAAL